MALVLGVDPRTHHLAFNTATDPRVYLAGSTRLVRDSREATLLMRAGHDFHHIALVEQSLGLAGAPAPSSREDGVAITRFEPERISVAVKLRRPRSWSWPSPGIRVVGVVNGLPAPCIPANLGMRAAVPVPAGKSQVVLNFSLDLSRAGRGHFACDAGAHRLLVGLAPDSAKHLALLIQILPSPSLLRSSPAASLLG